MHGPNRPVLPTAKRLTPPMDGVQSCANSSVLNIHEKEEDNNNNNNKTFMAQKNNQKTAH